MLRLEGDVTIYQAAALKQTLLAQLQGEGPVAVLDLSAVTAIDSAGVQLLILAWNAAAQARKTLIPIGASDKVRRVFELFNLAAYCGDPIADESTAGSDR